MSQQLGFSEAPRRGQFHPQGSQLIRSDGLHSFVLASTTTLADIVSTYILLCLRRTLIMSSHFQESLLRQRCLDADPLGICGLEDSKVF